MIHRYPNEVVISDAATDAADGNSTPAGEPDDDFFSSWDKPSIKRPTPPISRTATPPVVGRTPSPFLNAGANAAGNGIARATSPLGKADGTAAAPTASRITSSAALRKSATTGAGPRKANVLGAKKTKLGAKKVTGDVIDFDAAERKAKEEAERIEKLGYDPEAEEATTKKSTAKAADLSSIAAPTPVSPGRAGYGSGHSRERSNGEVERLGMGMGRLGFGQIGGAKPAATAQKKMGGFGSVGPIKATKEGKILHSKVTICRISKLTILQMTMRNTLDKSSAAKKEFHPMSFSARGHSILAHNQKPKPAYKVSKEQHLSHPMLILEDLKKKRAEKIMVISRPLQRTL